MIFCGLSILTSKKTGETLDNVTMLCYDNGVTLLRKEDAMTEKLISKKELLEKYGISYGALYRWKRKGLIPEEWFIKKSTVTGQETFFPEALICERMERIREQKDDISLDELSRRLHRETEKRAVLHIRTAFGEKNFYLNEIQSILLDDGEGNITNITEALLPFKEKD